MSASVGGFKGERWASGIPLQVLTPFLFHYTDASMTG